MMPEPKQRSWVLDSDPISVGDDDELYEALIEATGILRRIGGVVQIAAMREELAPDVYATTGFYFEWHSFAPAQRRKPQQQTEDPPAESQPEPEPVSAGA